MKNWQLTSVLLVLQCIGMMGVVEADSPVQEEAWVELFDGKTLKGWKPVVENSAFRVRDGMILAGGTDMNHLFYEGPVQGGQFQNFDLILEAKTTAGSNSGVFFHTEPQEGFLLKGYEAQINATHKDKRKSGSLLDVEHLSTAPAADDQWFELQITVTGKRIQIKVDGQTTVDYTQPIHPERTERRKQRVLSSGQIALQAHDPDSLVYFRNIRIRPLPDSDSQTSLVVGNRLPEEGGPENPQPSPLHSPFGIDFDSRGNMVIVELEGGRVHRLDTAGTLSQLAGDGSEGYTGDGGPASKAIFNGMHNVAITPKDDIYIADSWNHCIRKIDGKTGRIETFAGTGQAGYSGDGGPAREAAFDFLMCITLNSAGDQLYVADLKNLRIRAIDLNTGLIRLVAGNGQKGVPRDGDRATESPLVDPRAVTVDSQNNVYILERGGHALRRVSKDGLIETVAGTGVSGFVDGAALQSQLNSPKHVCVDLQDNVYIADDQNRAIRKFDPEKKTISTVLGRGLGTPWVQLKRPHGVCIEDGKLYVVDSGNNRILRVE